MAAIEQCHRKAAKSRIKPWITKDRWYQKYSLSDGYDNRNPSKKVEQKSLADKYAIGDEISSIEAVNPELQNDTRPRFFDNVTKTWTLLDSGSCVSCIPRNTKDKLDPKVKLRAVNGQSIPTYGSAVVTIRIGRKEYSIEAIQK